MGIYSFRKRIDDKYIYYKLDFNQNILPQILQILYENKLQSLLVEGGSQLLQSFIDEEIWDEIYIEYSEALLHKGVKHPVVPAGYGKQVLSRDKKHHHSL